jgi:hypothetical protein
VLPAFGEGFDEAGAASEGNVAGSIGIGAGDGGAGVGADLGGLAGARVSTHPDREVVAGGELLHQAGLGLAGAVVGDEEAVPGGGDDFAGSLQELIRGLGGEGGRDQQQAEKGVGHAVMMRGKRA